MQIIYDLVRKQNAWPQTDILLAKWLFYVQVGVCFNAAIAWKQDSLTMRVMSSRSY